MPSEHIGTPEKFAQAALRTKRFEEKTGVFSIPEMIVHLSTACTLEHGDVLFSGRPDGVGLLMKPPCFLPIGDRARGEIDGLGSFENQVVAEPETTEG